MAVLIDNNGGSAAMTTESASAFWKIENADSLEQSITLDESKMPCL